MWGNDYPHHDSTWPCSPAVVDALMEGVPDVDRELMTSGTAAALYQLG